MNLESETYYLRIQLFILVMEHKFVSESIKPVIATADTGAMATGGPGLPHEFTWRGKAPDSKGQC